MTFDYQELKPQFPNYREAVVELARSHIGALAVRYTTPELGSSPQTGFDCSGFARFVLVEAGVPVPDNVRNVRHFFDSFGVLVHRGVIEPADLIFFSWGGTFPQHMGIVVDPTHYVHAHTADRVVKKSRIQDKVIYKPPKAALYTHNPIGFKRLAFPNAGYNWVI